ncbi:hypothetical protein BH11PSE5_BH11PSE5_10620 [soil metagenome]
MITVLFLLAVAGPTITLIDDSRFRVGIVFDDTSPSGQTDAQLALMKAAERACKGKGKAISEGTLNLDNAPSIRPNRKALALSEIYSCRPKS